MYVSQTLYNSVIEEKITIEQVNTMGARLAKEARVRFMPTTFALTGFGVYFYIHLLLCLSLLLSTNENGVLSVNVCTLKVEGKWYRTLLNG
jgi:hypothetical protein